MCIVIGALGCNHGTYVELTLQQVVSSPPTVKIVLALALDGENASVTLANPGNSPLVFPATLSLQPGITRGRMSVSAVASDASGTEIDQASDAVDLVAGKTVPLELTLGGTVVGNDGPIGDGPIGDGPIGDGDAASTPGVPGPPTNVLASSGNGLVTVSWTAPSDIGTSPIVSYTVTASPGGTSVATPAGTTMATVAGLMNGTTYTFSVAATNSSGTGPAAISNPATPTATPMVPLAPTNVMAVANVDHGATVSWTGSDNRGSPLMGYAVSATQLTGTLATAGPTATTTTVTGLTPGSPYTFTVTATNGIGPSNASFPSNTITASTVPGAPTAVMANPNIPGGASVSWTAPSSNGFSPITKYTVAASPGGQTASTADGSTTSAKVTGLTVGMQYTFTVVATNGIGDGPASSASSAATVLPQLPAPAGVGECISVAGEVTVSFNAVSGAQSYDVFYNTAMPATAGTKLNVVGSPVMIMLPRGSYYFAVAAVNNTGDGVASADQPVTNDGQLHDTLFVAERTSNGSSIDIFDCFSTLADGTSAPTRRVSPAPSPTSFGTPIAVDPVNSVLFLSEDQRIGIWTGADSVNGSVAANYTKSIIYSSYSIAVDPIHHKLYWGHHSGVSPIIDRFPYTSAAALSGASSEASLQFSTVPTQLYVNPANGDLWGTGDFRGGANPQDGVVFQAAYGLNNGDGPTKSFAFNTTYVSGNFDAVGYSTANGGSLFVGNTETYWLTGVDSASSGTFTPSGSFTTTKAVSLASTSSLLLVFNHSSVSGSSYEVQAWSTSNLSGNPIKTVSANDNSSLGGGGIVYIP
jgi:hypothetical protein